jgi:hypothetical protein
MIIISENYEIPSVGLWMGGEGDGNLNSCLCVLGLPPLFTSVYGFGSVLGMVRGWGATLDCRVLPWEAEPVSLDTANWPRCTRLTTRNRKENKYKAINVNKSNAMPYEPKMKFLLRTHSSNTTWTGPRNSYKRRATVTEAVTSLRWLFLGYCAM